MNEQVYVERGGSNKVVATRRWPRPGDTERLAADHPDLVARRAAGAPVPADQQIEDRINADPVLSALVDVLADRFPNTTRSDLISEARAKVRP